MQRRSSRPRLMPWISWFHHELFGFIHCKVETLELSWQSVLVHVSGTQTIAEVIVELFQLFPPVRVSERIVHLIFDVPVLQVPK